MDLQGLIVEVTVHCNRGKSVLNSPIFTAPPKPHQKCLYNLQTLKPHRVNIPSSFDVFIVPELLLALQIQPISHLDVAFH